MKRWLFFVMMLAGTAALTPAHAQGIVIRPDGGLADLRLEAHRVEADVTDQVAVVTVTHTFRNPGTAVAEGTFLFPLPPGAQVSRFSMTVDGTEMAGELLSAEEARRIYEEIVRRSLDPALLEMADYRTFRARVFPIPGGAERTITLRYDATLPREGNTITFQYPMQGLLSTRHTAIQPPRPMPPIRRETGREARPDAPDRTPTHSLIRLTLGGQATLRNLYSPSHPVEIVRDGGRRATVTLEHTAGLDGRDFIFYYSVDPSDIGATLLTHRPYTDRPGYFMLLLAPPFEVREDAIQPKDLVFVLDTSGSMRGEKMTQAKAALQYALNSLGARDRFGVVTFSSEVDAFRDELAPTAACEDALFFVDQLEARGGTNIHDALLAALRLLGDSPRGQIVFLTDGLPSSGITDEGQILRAFAEANDADVRLFPFGMGYDVNTKLLDGLAADAGAFADYISPDENIEARVSTFYDKIRYPVMTDLAFTLDGAEAYAFAPAALPDLYKGGQILLAGRYRAAGPATLTLRGRVEGRTETRRFQFDFPAAERERDFVARLWATRRVGQLLDEIRRNGEHDELKGEVVALAKEFGLVTPYTAYLVTEEEAMANAVPTFRRFDAPRPVGGQAGNRDQARQAAPAMDATSGRAAVEVSKSIRAMQEADLVAAPPAEARRTVLHGRTLLATDDGWVDDAYDPEADTPVRLKFASDAYFAFLRHAPDARPFARLGDQVTFFFAGHFVQIGEAGADAITEAELRRLFGPSPVR